MLKILDIIKDLSSPLIDFEYKKLPQDDPMQRRPDIHLAKKELNWEPKIELKDGLIKTIDWFKKNYNF